MTVDSKIPKPISSHNLPFVGKKQSPGVNKVELENRAGPSADAENLYLRQGNVGPFPLCVGPTSQPQFVRHVKPLRNNGLPDLPGHYIT